jgi:indole-3-acetate monooxygenase
MTATGSAHDLLDAVAALVPALTAATSTSDQERRLPADLIDAMVENGLLRMLLPRDLGGLQIDPIAAARIVEEVSRHNGSAGWVLMILNGNAHWAGSLLPKEHAEQIFGHDPRSLMAGTFNPNGRAVRVPGGYRVTGRWSFGSGSLHASWFASGCVLYEGDQPVMGQRGPRWRNFVTPLRDVEVLDTWHTTGLRGTGSNDYVITDAFVPDGWDFNHFTDSARLPDPNYAYGVLPFPLLAAVLLGIARSALDGIMKLVSEKIDRPTGAKLRDDPYTQMEIARAEAALAPARSYLYEMYAAVWQTLQAGDPLTQQQRGSFRLAVTHAVEAAVQAVDIVHGLAGSTAIFQDHPIERAFRDVHTGATHFVVRPPGAYTAAGELLLGKEPAFRMF